MRVLTVDLSRDYTEAIREALKVFAYGGVIVYPTDTLYALGANALDQRAAEKVFAIKKRSFSKPLPIMVKNLLWAKELAMISARNEEILNKVWPGKVTAVLPKRDLIPAVVTAGQAGIGIRIPEYEFTDKLLGKFGYPVTATSANIAGDEGLRDSQRVIELFSKSEYKPDLVIDAGALPESDPSTVLDLTSERPKILRVGSARPEQLLKLLQI